MFNIIDTLNVNKYTERLMIFFSTLSFFSTAKAYSWIKSFDMNINNQVRKVLVLYTQLSNYKSKYYALIKSF